MTDDFMGFHGFSRTVLFGDIRTEMVEYEICFLTSALSFRSLPRSCGG